MNFHPLRKAGPCIDRKTKVAEKKPTHNERESKSTAAMASADRQGSHWNTHERIAQSRIAGAIGYWKGVWRKND